MTALLEQAVNTVRALPAEAQDGLARLLLQLLGQEPPDVALTPAEADSFRESLAQTARGEHATDEQVASVWAKHGL